MIAITELRLAGRRITRRPLFAVLAITTLAIGIGANTAVFSLLEGVALLGLAAANVTALFAVRAVERKRGIAIRRALGSGSRGWLFEAWSEPLLVVAAGAVAAVLLARQGLHLLIAVAPPSMARFDEVTISLPVLAFTTLVSIGAAVASTALVASLSPAARAARIDPASVLLDE